MKTVETIVSHESGVPIEKAGSAIGMLRLEALKGLEIEPRETGVGMPSGKVLNLGLVDRIVAFRSGHQWKQRPNRRLAMATLRQLFLKEMATDGKKVILEQH